MAVINVGTTTLTYYPHLRNFVGLPYNRVRYIKMPNMLGLLGSILVRLDNINLLKISSRVLQNLMVDLRSQECDILHLFNTIPITKKPWITTFETCIPRWALYCDKGIESAMKYMSQMNCKKLISISRDAYQRQLRLISKTDVCEELVSKIEIIHPPQKLIINRYEQKNIDNSAIFFTIVGHDFFRKGGKEVISVFDELLQKKYPIKLNIVSKLRYADYASKASKSDLRIVQQIIDKHQKDIIHYEDASHNDVKELFVKSHVGLLPTYDDTYGYSVLEAQAAGCPVVTTDIRALTEINNNENGWVIEVPKDDMNTGLFRTERERDRYSEVVRECLYATITEIVNNSERIEEKGRKCLIRIENVHSPDTNAKLLESLYMDVVCGRL